MGKRDEKARGGWVDWLADRALRGMIALALALPHETRVRLMGCTVRRIIAPLAGYRRRSMENLAHVWPGMPEAERRRMIIDVAHASPRMVEEVLQLSDRPVILSHGGFKGVCDSARNLEDALMIELAESGALIGVGFWEGKAQAS